MRCTWTPLPARVLPLILWPLDPRAPRALQVVTAVTGYLAGTEVDPEAAHALCAQVRAGAEAYVGAGWGMQGKLSLGGS